MNLIITKSSLVSFCLLALWFGSGSALAQDNNVRPAVATAGANAKAQNQPEASPSERQTLQDILGEMRQLRQMLYRTYRSQILVERLRTQQQRVDKFLQELEELQLQLKDAVLTRPRLQERVKELEAMMNQEPDPARRANLMLEYRDVKANLDQREAWEQQQRERESQLMRTLQAEQMKLTECTDQLDELQRDLEKLLADKPALSVRNQ